MAALSLRLGTAAANELLEALAGLHRAGPGGLRACRPLFADLLGWPDGTLDECATIEHDFPAWLVWYYPASMAWPDSWAAIPETGFDEPVSRTTSAQLRAAIRAEATG